MIHGLWGYLESEGGQGLDLKSFNLGLRSCSEFGVCDDVRMGVVVYVCVGDRGGGVKGATWLGVQVSPRCCSLRLPWVPAAEIQDGVLPADMARA